MGKDDHPHDSFRFNSQDSTPGPGVFVVVSVVLTSLLSDWSFAAPLSRTRITEADRDGVGWKIWKDSWMVKKWKSP